MKHLSFIFLLFFSTVMSYGQAPAIQWQKTLGGSQHDFANSVAITPDSGYIVAGSTKSNDGDVSGNHGNYDYFVAKLSAAGAIQWKKTYGGSGDDEAYSIISTFDGSYVVTGFASSGDGDVTGYHGNTDAWVVKISATGAIIWQKSLGGSNLDEIYSIRQTIDSGYILAGITNSNDGDVSGNHGLYDCWVVKLNAAGAIQWQKSLGGSATERAFSGQQTADSCYIIAGGTASNDGDVSGNHGADDYWVAKLSATGSLLWQKCYGGTGNEDARSIIQTADGGYIMAGSSDVASGDITVNYGASDYWLVKLSATGALQWQKSFGGSGIEYPSSVIQMPDSSYVASGTTLSNDGDVSGNHGSFDTWIVKLTAAGVKQWQKSLGGTQAEDNYFMGTDIHKTNDAGYVVCASTASNDGDVSGGHGLFDDWVVKLNCGFSVGDITGSHSVCIDATTVLGDTALGGVWSASNTNVGISGGVVTAVKVGTSVITYTLSTACGAATTTFSLAVTPCTPTIDKLVEADNVIAIAPNPASSSISITGIDKANVRIYNTIGRLMTEANEVSTVSIAAYPPGMYFVTLSSEGGLLLGQYKIIKQ